MKILIAALISAALFIWAPHIQSKSPINNSESKPAHMTKTEKPASAEKAVTVVVPAEQPEAQAAETQSEAQPTPQAEVAQVSHPVGCENYRQLISMYDWNVETFLQIAKAESGCNPSAVGDNRMIGGIHAPSCGLFQIRTLASRPSCEALKDPATNIAWAYRIYQGQGHAAWSVCRTTVNCL